MTAASLQLCQVAFLPWILVASDDDSMLVLPQVEDALGFSAVEHQVFLHGKIGVRVVSGAFNVVDFIDHEY